MATCNGCGGIVGRDCFNPSECEYITNQMNSQDDYQRGYKQAQIDEHERLMQQDYYNSINPDLDETAVWEEVGRTFTGIVGNNQWLDAIDKLKSKYKINKR